jgi:hypothetical protein
LREDVIAAGRERLLSLSVLPAPKVTVSTEPEGLFWLKVVLASATLTLEFSLEILTRLPLSSNVLKV